MKHFFTFLYRKEMINIYLLVIFIVSQIIFAKKEQKLKEMQNKQIENKNKQIKKLEEDNQILRDQVEKMKPVFNEVEIKKNFPQFSDSEIIKDIEDAQKLKELINDDEFFSKIKKGFSAKRDGFDCKKWHSLINEDKGETLVIIKTKDNFIFGGFTQVGFFPKDESKWSRSYQNIDSNYITDPNAFIFSLRNDKGDRKPEKFAIKEGKEGYAIEFLSNKGPSFGGRYGGKNDFFIESNLKTGYSDFGYSYNLPDGIEYGTSEAQSYLAGSYESWFVDELETYFI
ncbi:e3 ubiquitin-protein ligase [Anaeramoeba ignava]|uniref:E3 ubiquitin-protein ligase n=1 Tax=Anaeramoeba ignava TaxID=1746090 RepID=A0A9Q0R9R8_ANAIG|nr:e3 ubiquitin-protein ligase [Anaeramoeba ignava]